MSEEIQILGYSLADIRKIDNWLRCQNATIDDIDCCSLNWHYWKRERLFESMLRYPL